MYAWLLVSKRASLQSAHPMQLGPSISPLLLLRQTQCTYLPHRGHLSSTIGSEV